MKGIVLLCLIFVVNSLQEDCCSCDKCKMEFLVDNAMEFVFNPEIYMKNYTANLEKHFKENNKAFEEDVIGSTTALYAATVNNRRIFNCVQKYRKNVAKESALLTAECANSTMNSIAKNLTIIKNNLEKIKDSIAEEEKDVSFHKGHSNPAQWFKAFLPNLFETYNEIITLKNIKATAIESNTLCFGVKTYGNDLRKGSAVKVLRTCVKREWSRRIHYDAIKYATMAN